VANGPTVKRGDPHRDGRCDFCLRPPGRAIYVLLSGEEPMVNICPLCAAELIKNLETELT